MARGVMRWQAKGDVNQPDIVAALEKAGCSVLDLSRVGKGCTDLLVGRDGCNYLMEVKTLTGKLNTKQVKFHSEWRGKTYVVRTPEEALRIVLNG